MESPISGFRKKVGNLSPEKGRFRYPSFWSTFSNNIFAFELSTTLMEGDISLSNDVIRQPEIQNSVIFFNEMGGSSILEQHFSFLWNF